jgi:hypothetical protein
MKKLLFLVFIIASLGSKAQVYNNEWIDHSKTYYKFKVGKTGVYRIPQSVLASAGLGNTPAEQFQLWRNGVQVPIYLTKTSGALSGTDYIEFWGEMNDGKPDRELYRNPDYQLNDKWSLQTDSATYFLTTNIQLSANRRLRDVVNDIAGNRLPAEPYFMHTAGQYFSLSDGKINGGHKVNVGTDIYSSAYDEGEGFTSNDIVGNTTFAFDNLNVYNNGPAATFKIGLSGNSINPRRYTIRINGDSILGNTMDYFHYSRAAATFPVALLSSNRATVEFQNSNVSGDAVVIHQFEVTYPRQFEFGGQQNFEFDLPASSIGNYLEIKNFSYGSSTPVLLDITNGKRYTADISTPGTLKIALEPSLSARHLVLVSQEAANIASVSSLTSRNFVDYSQPANQGTFLIITNSLLIPASGANPVEDYRQYRSSAEGGGYKATIALIDELVDQFAFGIKKHPMSVRNYLLYARQQFSVKPKSALLIGRGVNYVNQRYSEKAADMDRLNLVPTFGNPASDILLAADKGDGVPKIGIGRLSVVQPSEITIYLNKVKEYEAQQRVSSPLVKDKAWMKNVVHAVGSSEPTLQRMLDYYMADYNKIISDTLFGAKVYTLTKSSAEAVQLISSKFIDKLFADGISLITYFGHSSATGLEFNLNDPQYYNNKGKYPLFIALGCKVSDFYGYPSSRLAGYETLSEKFVLAQERGTIGFMASTNWGIPHYLHIYNSRAYKHLVTTNYGKSVGEIMQATIADMFDYTSQEDFYARSQCEQFTFHGDPAIVINSHAKPDYAIEESQIRIDPSFISVAERSFNVKVKILNIGKAINQDLVVEIKREYPDKTTEVIYKEARRGTRYEDEFSIDIPIDAIRDKGNNKLIITLDPENKIDELFETNNSITKDIIIYAEEAKLVYPYNFAIINKPTVKFVASTANPFAPSRLYRFELDTTAAFSSAFKVSSELTAKGGIIEFSPQVTFKDNTVYYWRVASVPATGDIKWNTSSFIYLANHELGYNQSDTGQHIFSSGADITLDNTTKQWRFDSAFHLLSFVNYAAFTATTNASELAVVKTSDGFSYGNTCRRWNTLVFTLFNPGTFKPVPNLTGSDPDPAKRILGNCGNATTVYNFEFSYNTSAERKKVVDFMNSIPEGYFVVVRNIIDGNNPGPLAPDWKNDESALGVGNTLYDMLKEAGFSNIDEYNKARTFVLIYQKNRKEFVPVSHLSPTSGIENGKLRFDHSFKTPVSTGQINSPVFGPAKSWKQALWKGESGETPSTDEMKINVIGKRKDGTTNLLIADIDLSSGFFDISTIDAKEYPYLQLNMTSTDIVNFTPYQLKHWRVTYDPSPEGAVAPNMLFNMKDTFDVGEPIDFKLAFKNISDVPFADSIKVNMLITDRNNVTQSISVGKQKPVISGDTLVISQSIASRNLVGTNTLFVDINPNNDQAEEYLFNNFIFHNFYVKGDSLSPMLDVTFDNDHILNGDIVAAKPKIQIKLKDDARWMLLDDQSLVTVQVKYPGEQTQRVIEYNSDTLRFTPVSSNQSNKENAATIDFTPHFIQDGDYELIVNGKDKSENNAGDLEYKVKFKVINKPMISNMLNYPNPFTTSTAFVFTLTGTEVPQNLKIQILTITGKIVREITKAELGPLRIGRNITEFKWDGTDQYGQKLGNGVYLYRVVTNLNGKSLDKYKASDDNTDKYFNNGYGKMYLMR